MVPIVAFTGYCMSTSKRQLPVSSLDGESWHAICQSAHRDIEQVLHEHVECGLARRRIVVTTIVTVGTEVVAEITVAVMLLVTQNGHGFYRV